MLQQASIWADEQTEQSEQTEQTDLDAADKADEEDGFWPEESEDGGDEDYGALGQWLNSFESRRVLHSEAF